MIKLLTVAVKIANWSIILQILVICSSTQLAWYKRVKYLDTGLKSKQLSSKQIKSSLTICTPKSSFFFRQMQLSSNRWTHFSCPVIEIEA